MKLLIKIKVFIKKIIDKISNWFTTKKEYSDDEIGFHYRIEYNEDFESIKMIIAYYGNNSLSDPKPIPYTPEIVNYLREKGEIVIDVSEIEDNIYLNSTPYVVNEW